MKMLTSLHAIPSPRQTQGVVFTILMTGCPRRKSKNCRHYRLLLATSFSTNNNRAESNCKPRARDSRKQLKSQTQIFYDTSTMRVDNLLFIFLASSFSALLGQSFLAHALNLETRTLSTTSSPSDITSRRGWLQNSICGGLLAGIGVITHDASPAVAAPPIAVIAEELGYFPVQNRDGDVMYIPKKVQRESTQQAIELAKLMNEKGVKMYGAYWCPHCSRQKELFGAEAWRNIEYVECSPKGYGFKGTCKNVDGYPTFLDKRGKINFSGERSLADLAKQVGYTNFDPSVESEVPMVGTACKLR